MATSPGDPQAYPMCQQLTHEGQILQDMQALMHADAVGEIVGWMISEVVK